MRGNDWRPLCKLPGQAFSKNQPWPLLVFQITHASSLPLDCLLRLWFSSTEASEIHFLFHPHFSSPNPSLAGLLTRSHYCWFCTLPAPPAMTSLTSSPTAPAGSFCSSKTPARLPASPVSSCFTISEIRHQPADILSKVSGFHLPAPSFSKSYHSHWCLIFTLGYICLSFDDFMMTYTWVPDEDGKFGMARLQMLATLRNLIPKMKSCLSSYGRRDEGKYLPWEGQQILRLMSRFLLCKFVGEYN